MNRLSLITATLLLGSSVSFADGEVTNPVTGKEAESAEASPWSFKLSAEGRARPKTKVNQFLIRLDYGYTLSDDFSLFGAVWARNRQQSGYTTNSDFFTAADLMLGVYYDLNKYINPYAFYEMYWDAEKGSWNNYESVWSSFGSVGVSGTLYSEKKHFVSYYAEYYFSLGTQEGGYANEFTDNFMPYGSEFALKYTYAVYDKTSLYYQPTWYTYGDGNIFDKGNLEHRFGISVAF